MNLDCLLNTNHRYSVVVFMDEKDVVKHQAQLEKWGALKHVQMVVQPCPFEGIEFLFRFHFDFEAQLLSADQEVFWHALKLSPATEPSKMKNISEQHYQFLLSVLDQKPSIIQQRRATLNAMLKS